MMTDTNFHGGPPVTPEQRQLIARLISQGRVTIAQSRAPESLR